MKGEHSEKGYIEARIQRGVLKNKEVRIELGEHVFETGVYIDDHFVSDIVQELHFSLDPEENKYGKLDLKLTPFNEENGETFWECICGDEFEGADDYFDHREDCETVQSKVEYGKKELEADETNPV